MPLTPEEQQELASLEAEVAAPQAPIQAGGSVMTPEEQQELAQLEEEVGSQLPRQESKYESNAELAKTGLEGFAEGVAGPLAPLIEKHVLEVKPSEMRARRETNPGVFATGQAAGIAGSMLVGVGEGAVLTKAGAGVAELANIGKAGSITRRITTEAIDQAVQSALLQSSDEVSKMIINDPNSSAENAIANVGLATALGGVTGAGIGSANPIWKATLGPKLDELLVGVKGHLDNAGPVLPEDVDAALNTLGIQVDDVTRAGLSKDVRGAESYGILRENDNKIVKDGLIKLNSDIEQSVASRLGMSTDDLANYSENEAGHDLLNAFKKEYDTKYAPIAEKLEKRNAEAATIGISDEARLNHYGKMLEDGMTNVGTDSPQYELYNSWGNRLLAKENVGGIDKLKTEIANDIKAAERAADYNKANALKDIRKSLADFQENQIVQQAKAIGSDAADLADGLIAERAMINKSYADFANMSNQLMDHLGVGNFSGAKTLTNKLTDKVSAEQLLNKFSIKGNADFIPFLKQNFPEVYAKVQENELKRFLKPAYLSAKGEAPFNVKKLADLVEKGMAGQKEYVEALLTPEAIQAIEAGKKLMSSVPEHRSSGTAGWLSKLTKGVPASGMAAVAMLVGQNPILGAILGQTASYLGKDAPDALRLGYLKFLGSGQPVKAEGFRAMIDYMQNTYQGQKAMNKATKAIFQAGSKVAIKEASSEDTAKLDKVVDMYTKNPDKVLQLDNGELGHYLGEHQMSLTSATIKAAQYLSQLKPRPYRSSPLDAEIEPTDAQMQRYNRALVIAQQPLSVLQKVQDGTLQASDIQDLTNLYPALYTQLASRMSNELMTAQAEGTYVPYQTKIGISLLIGQALDSSMSPSSIQAAQPIKKPEMTQAGQAPVKNKKGTSNLGKSNKDYMTPTQSRQSEKNSGK